MKKIIITTLVIFGMVISGMAFAQGFGPQNRLPMSDQGLADNGDQQGVRPGKAGPRHPRNAGGHLGKVLHENMMMEALVELTGETAEAIKAKIEETGFREFMEASGIDRETLKPLMDEKTVSLADKLSGCGVITQEQADEIIEKIKEQNAQDDENA